MAGSWKFLALLVCGLTLRGAMALAGAEPVLPPKTDEELLAFSLSIEGCVGVVQVLKRTVDSGADGDYTEFLDVKPIRWLSGTCGSSKTAKLRLYSRPHSSFGFMSTGDWEVAPRDTVIVFTYHDRNRSYVSQTPHTLWHGLAKATPEKIQFLESNIPRILESDSLGRRDTTR